MGGLFGDNSAQVPPPPPPPPAAAPPTYANANVQAGASGAKQRMQAAAGAGFANTLFTGPQGVAGGASDTAKQTLGG
jgi:hypothetical protein